MVRLLIYFFNNVWVSVLLWIYIYPEVMRYFSQFVVNGIYVLMTV